MAPGGVVAFFAGDLVKLSQLQAFFRFNERNEYTHVKLHEYFTREHQILPQRTHPVMKPAVPLMQGFVLAATRVQYDAGE